MVHFNNGDLHLMLKYLVKNGYVHYHSDAPVFSIEYEGKVLIEKGGLVAKEKKRIRKVYTERVVTAISVISLIVAAY